MTSISQKNLLKLAEENKRKGDIEAAIQNFEAALRELYEETSIDWRDESPSLQDSPPSIA